MLVDCYDPKGAEVYEMIVKQVFQDLQLTRSVKDLRIYADPREPVFIIAIKADKTMSPILIEDLAAYEYDSGEDKTFIRIRDETYLPELMEKLWEMEGRGKIQQPTRFDVIIESPSHDLKGLMVHDPAESLKRKIYDAIFRIIPEGFRVIRDLSQGPIVAMVCTDEILKEEWIEKCKNMIEELKED